MAQCTVFDYFALSIGPTYCFWLFCSLMTWCLRVPVTASPNHIVVLLTPIYKEWIHKETWRKIPKNLLRNLFLKWKIIYLCILGNDSTKRFSIDWILTVHSVFEWMVRNLLSMHIHCICTYMCYIFSSPELKAIFSISDHLPSFLPRTTYSTKLGTDHQWVKGQGFNFFPQMKDHCFFKGR